MPNDDKDKEIARLRLLLKRKNALISELRTNKSPVKEKKESKELVVKEAKDITSNKIIEDETDLPIDIVQQVREIFGDEIRCSVCKSLEVEEFSLCTSCGIGWAYCDDCGGFERAQIENRMHITPTHGVFLDMFDKYEMRNEFSKPS